MNVKKEAGLLIGWLSLALILAGCGAVGSQGTTPVKAVHSGQTMPVNGVIKKPLAMSVTSSPNPITVSGQTATITVNLGKPVNDGTVLLTGSGPDGSLPPFQNCTPTGGVCTFLWNPPWSTGPTGNWTFSANWTGDGQYSPATGYLSIKVSVWGGGP